jgi:peptidoglycan/xylan/chitin deacetylase (PgdA/CDA1 family)
MLMLYATLVPNCQWWGPVVTYFETPRREVWLTIDDGPDRVHTARMLEMLKRFEAKATFFVVGRRAAQFPAELRAIRDAGHDLGNHTATHPSATFWCLPPRRIAAEIGGCNVPAPYFRAVVGMKNLFVHPVLARRGLKLIGWSVRGLDTVSHDVEAVVARVMRGVKPGAIVVLHQGHRLATEPDFQPRCLERTLFALTNAGYSCVLPAPEQLRAGCRRKTKR